MTISTLKKQFYQAVHPSHPNEWELEEALEPLVGLQELERQALISYVRVIWPISHSLCISYLHYGHTHIRKLTSEHLAEWVRQLLFWYEKDGLRGSRLFMSEIENNYFARLGEAAGAQFDEVRSRLIPFIRGVSGRKLEVLTASSTWSDGGTIYLPEVVDYFPLKTDNLRYYSFLACCQWGFIQLGTLKIEINPAFSVESLGMPEKDDEPCLIEDYLKTFADPLLAGKIFHLLEFSRVYSMLRTELPGLLRSVQPLLEHLLIEPIAGGSKKHGFFREWLYFIVLGGSGSVPAPNGLPDIVSDSMEMSCCVLKDRYIDIERIVGEEDWEVCRRVIGRLRFDKAREHQLSVRVENEAKVIQQLAMLLYNEIHGQEVGEGKEAEDAETVSGEGDTSRAVVMLQESDEGEKQAYSLTIDNAEIEIPQDLAELLSEVAKDLGFVPDGYVQAAAGIAGRGRAAGESKPDSGGSLQKNSNAFFYDEWDFRRQGYRKEWCALYEKDVQPVISNFVANALERYRGLRVRLRRQFEMLRTQHRFVRRRRFGDDVDFDALVDAMGDRMAGLAPSERLFIRLLRDERDIAVLFLVDMSNSTEGWVGKAIKEALVLLCDVLEIVGDRYAILGFSGMRRSRCELFRIKQMDESYGEKIHRRISAISPREYTRMGPSIRHVTNQLLEVDAKIRLLVTLSDGKPEDYDDYKGEYAIEDTRKALLEAKGKGVLPFCITVDNQAHDYLEHMYGKGNYIYVNDVEKLPLRMPEIYRLLTS